MTRTLQQIIESEQEPTAEERAMAQEQLEALRHRLLDQYMTAPGPKSGYAISLLHAPRTIGQARQQWREVKPYMEQIAAWSWPDMSRVAQETIERVLGS